MPTTEGKIYLGSVLVASGACTMDEDAVAYLTAIEGDGAGVTWAQAVAVSDFVVAQKASGAWAALKRLYFPIWAVASANARCMVSATSGTFVGGVTHGAGFVTGDGSTSYFDVGATTSTLGLSTGDVAIMRGIHIDGSSAHDACGVTSGTGTNSLAMLNYASSHGSAGSTYYRQPGISAAATLTGQGTDYRGIYIGSSISTASRFLQRRRSGGTVVVKSFLADGSIITNANPYFLGRNNGGTLNLPTSGSEFVWSLGDGMTETLAGSFTADIETMWETCTGLTLF